MPLANCLLSVMPPLSALELTIAFIVGAAARGILVGLASLIAVAWLANVMPGRVAGVSPTRVQLDAGPVLESAQAGFAVGDRVEAVVRPEHVELGTGAAAPVPNAFEARATSVVFLGNLSDIVVESAGLSLRCQASPPRRLPVGQAVTVRIAPDQVVLLAAEGGPGARG